MWPTFESDQALVIIQDSGGRIYADLRKALALRQPLLLVGKGPGRPAQAVQEAQAKRERKKRLWS